jgi:hypothetical protein
MCDIAISLQFTVKEIPLKKGSLQDFNPNNQFFAQLSFRNERKYALCRIIRVNAHTSVLFCLPNFRPVGRVSLSTLQILCPYRQYKDLNF